jgi:beta-lactamase class D
VGVGVAQGSWRGIGVGVGFAAGGACGWVVGWVPRGGDYGGVAQHILPSSE